MPSNNDLKAQIGTLSAEVGVEVDTDGMNNEALAAKVSELKATAKAAEEAAATTDALRKQADELAAKAGVEVDTAEMDDEALAAKIGELQTAIDDAKAKAAEEAKPEVPPFTVSAGVALTTKRGILSDGDGIKADDLSGGADALNAFVKSGHVTKN